MVIIIHSARKCKRAVVNAARFIPASMAEKALEVYESVQKR